MNPSQSTAQIVTQLCRECRQSLGEWHDKNCGTGRTGPGHVRDIDVERTVYLALPGVLAAVDKIEREEYIEGGRCGDFKLALDAVREALA